MTPSIPTAAVRFPSTGHIWIPRHGRRAAAAGLSMHSPCRPTKVWAQRALYLGVRLVGSRMIPGQRTDWAPPVPFEQWTLLLEQWRDQVGEFDDIALYHRPQAGRTGFAALLLAGGRGVAFARVNPDAERIGREFRLLAAVHAAEPRQFVVARPIAHGTADASAWSLTESVPNYPLGALRNQTQRHDIAAEVAQVLTTLLPRPADTPPHWTPAHGDFAPWNLRTELRGTVRVIDWEDATWAPPGVDRLYGDVSAHTTFGTAPPQTANAEAHDWVSALVSGRAAPDGASQTDAALLAALAHVRKT